MEHKKRADLNFQEFMYTLWNENYPFSMVISSLMFVCASKGFTIPIYMSLALNYTSQLSQNISTKN